VIREWLDETPSGTTPLGHQDVVDRYTVDPKLVDHGNHALKPAPLVQALRDGVAADAPTGTLMPARNRSAFSAARHGVCREYG
jgi:hypothetical protein